MKIDVRMLIDRLKDAINVKNDSEIASILGIEANSLSSSVKRNSLSFKSIKKIHEISFENNLSLNWIFYGLDDKKSTFENIDKELIEDIKMLPSLKKEYYYHRIKADLIEEKLKNLSQDN